MSELERDAAPGDESGAGSPRFAEESAGAAARNATSGAGDTSGIDAIATKARRTYLQIVFLVSFASCWRDPSFQGSMLRYDGGFKGTFDD